MKVPSKHLPNVLFNKYGRRTYIRQDAEQEYNGYFVGDVVDTRLTTSYPAEASSIVVGRAVRRFQLCSSYAAITGLPTGGRSITEPGRRLFPVGQPVVLTRQLLTGIGVVGDRLRELTHDFGKDLHRAAGSLRSGGIKSPQAPNGGHYAFLSGDTEYRIEPGTCGRVYGYSVSTFRGYAVTTSIGSFMVQRPGDQGSRRPEIVNFGDLGASEVPACMFRPVLFEGHDYPVWTIPSLDLTPLPTPA